MNSNKEDSGWILCPSKSYPGKFYYFNVRNGEALWCSNDIDNKSARKDTAHEIADKLHCYPEPSSPPFDEYPSISNIDLNKTKCMQHNAFNNSLPNRMSNSTITNYGSNAPTNQNTAILTREKLFNISISKNESSSSNNNDSNMSTMQNTATFTPQKLFNISVPHETSNISKSNNGSNRININSGSYEPTKQNNAAFTPQKLFNISVSHSSNTNNDSYAPIKQNNATFAPQKLFNISIPNKTSHVLNTNNCSHTGTMQNKGTFVPHKLFNISVTNKPSSSNTEIMQNPIHAQKHFINLRRTILNQQKPYYIENSYQNFVQPSPQFSQAIFPKYFSNVDPYMQNVIWTPIHLPRPIYMADTVVKTEILDQNTPTWEDRDNVVVQSSRIPLTQRFVNFENNLPKIEDESDFLTDTQIFGPTDASTRNPNETHVPMFEPISTPNFHSTKGLTQSESVRRVVSSDFEEKANDSNCQIKFPYACANKQWNRVVISNDIEEKSNDTSFQIKGLSPTSEVPHTRSLFERNKLFKTVNDRSIVKYPNIKSNIVVNRNDLGPKSLLLNHEAETKNADSLELVKNDLRFLLMAKRRRSFDLEGLSSDVECNTTKSSDPKTSSVAGIPKKRVRFLINEHSDTSNEDIHQESVSNIITDDNKLRQKSNSKNIGASILQGINDGVVTTEMLEQERSNFMNIQITLKNETNPNLFLQSIDEFNPFPLNKDANLVNAFKIPVFKDIKVTNNNSEMRHIVSPININDLVNVDTSANKNNYSSDNESDTKEIGANMQNLFIKDYSAVNSKYQRQKIIFDVEDLNNNNAIKMQSSHKNGEIIKVIENDNRYQNVSTKQNETKHADNMIPIHKADRKTTEDKYKGKKIILNRQLRYKIDKFDANVNKKSNNANVCKDIDVNKNKDKLQVKERSMHTVIRSEIDKFNANHYRDVNISVEKEVTYNTNPSDSSSIIKPHANVDEKLKQLNNRLMKIVERPKTLCQDVENNLDGKLIKFQLKSELMSETIKLKMEELLCTYTQIMEEALSSLLQNSNSIINSLTPPWTLHEALTCIKKMYDNNEVTMYGDELTLLILNNSCKRGTLQSNLDLKNFTRIFGLGSLLIDCLKIIDPQCQELSEAQRALAIMWESITSPVDVDEEELTIPQPNRIDDEPYPICRKYFMKKTADVVQWLNNQSYLKDYTEQTDTKNKDTQIVRTFGRNINLLTINNTKSLTMNQPIDNVNNQIETNRSARPKTIRLTEKTDNEGTITQTDNLKSKPVKLDLLNKNADPKLMELFSTSTPKTIKENDIHIPTHGNTFQHNDADDGPKVIRNVKLIDAFEKKLQTHQDCAKIDETFSTMTFNISLITSDDVTDNKSQDMSIEMIENKIYEKNNDVFPQNNDKCQYNNENIDNTLHEYYSNSNKYEKNNDVLPQNNDKAKFNDEIINECLEMITENGNCVNNDAAGEKVMDFYDMQTQREVMDFDMEDTDSGLESDYTQMYSVLRMFLAKLSLSLKAIYKFIGESIVEFRDKNVQGDKLKSLRDKAVWTHEHILGIVYKLKCIIHRESGGSVVLKTLKCNAQASADVRITRYRQVVTKCLEQAEMLEDALKIVISIADGDLETPLHKYEQSPVYYNIFE